MEGISLSDGLSASGSEEVPLSQYLKSELIELASTWKSDLLNCSWFLRTPSKANVLLIGTDHEDQNQGEEIGGLINTFAASNHLKSVGTELCRTRLSQLKRLNTGPPWDQFHSVSAASRSNVNIIPLDRPFHETSRRAARLVGNQTLLRAWKLSACGPVCRTVAFSLCALRILQLTRSSKSPGGIKTLDQPNVSLFNFISKWAIPEALLDQLMIAGPPTDNISLTATARKWEEIIKQYAESRKKVHISKSANSSGFNRCDSEMVLLCQVMVNRAINGNVWYGHGQEKLPPGDISELNMTYLSGEEDKGRVQSVLQRIAIAERDAIFTESMKERMQLHNENDFGIAVIGRAHTSGIRKLWHENIPSEDILRLSNVKEHDSWWFPVISAPFERYVSRGFA